MIKEIYKIFDQKEYVVYDMYDGGSCFIFAIMRKGSKGPITDPFYSINKETLDIEGFVPFKNLELFNYARQHPVEY